MQRDSVGVQDISLERLNTTAGLLEPHWYAVYTNSNHEKRVALQLGQRSLEHFLPTYESVRRWKDRRKKLELPLFPGYVFVRMALCERVRVLQIPGVACLVGFGRVLAALETEEIEALKKGLSGGVRGQPHPYLTVGRRVLVKHGPLAGLQGILLKRKCGLRLVVSVDLIRRSMAVEIDEADVEPL